MTSIDQTLAPHAPLKDPSSATAALESVLDDRTRTLFEKRRVGEDRARGWTLIFDENQHVDSWARKRLHLKRDVTGMRQSLGRDDIPLEAMVALDYRYVTSWSLATI